MRLRGWLGNRERVVAPATLGATLSFVGTIPQGGSGCRAAAPTSKTMTAPGDYGAARVELEALRAELRLADPRIVFDGCTRSGAVRGRYRFRVGARPVSVAAPVTPAGMPRKWGRLWRVSPRDDQYPGAWRYYARRASVVEAILRMRPAGAFV